MRVLLHCMKRIYAIRADTASDALEFDSIESAIDAVRGSDVLMFGTRLNMALLERVMDSGIRVHIGTPSLLSGSSRPTGGLLGAVRRMSGVHQAMGGWRRAMEDDYLLSRVRAFTDLKLYGEGVVNSAASLLSIWPYVAFMEGASTQLVYVLSEYFDARWYTDPLHARRLGRFKAYAGFHLVMKDGRWSRPRDDAGSYNENLNAYVRRCLRPMMRSGKDLADLGPREVLRRGWKRYYSRLLATRDIDVSAAAVMSDTKMTQHFLNYLCLVWRDVLNGTSEFDPDEFFSYDDTAALWKARFGTPIAVRPHVCAGPGA